MNTIALIAAAALCLTSFALFVTGAVSALLRPPPGLTPPENADPYPDDCEGHDTH